MKKVFKSIVVVLSLVLILTGCTSAKKANTSSVEEIKERGVIKIGVFSDKPPFGFVDENGKNQGFDVYIAKRLAKDLLGDETKVEFVLVEAASRVEYLQSGKVDIILANFTVTDERKEKVDFADPYMKVSLGVVSNDGTPITNVDQLKDKKLIVNKGTTAETYFTKNYPEIELLKYDQNSEAFQALRDNRGVALAHDNTLVFAWAKENKGYSVGINSLGSLDYIAPAVQKGNKELLTWINDEFSKLKNEGFFQQAYDATLQPVYGTSVDSKSILID